MARKAFLALSCALLAANAVAAPFPGCQGGTLEGCPGSANCTTHYLEQPIDHFNWGAPLGNADKATFKQRYFLYDDWWSTHKDGTRGPIFFYFGNEDNVELYVNHTGLMWENAKDFGALMVFGEHRYYGESQLYDYGTAGCMNFLTSEQAMGDFAYLIDYVRENMNALTSPIIGFGGSYGGMVGSWFRIHYPNAVDGVIAASAPIWSFSGLHPAYNFNAFDATVADDASSKGHATDDCRKNLKAAWPRILAQAETEQGRQLLQKSFHMCSPLRPKGKGIDDGMSIVQWAGGPWGTMAMGNYPYSSSYLMHGESLLPPWPVRQACISLDLDLTDGSDAILFDAIRRAAAVYHNNTFDQPCFNITGQAPIELSNGTDGGLVGLVGDGDTTPVVKYSGPVPNAKRSKMTSPRVPTRRLRPLGQQTNEQTNGAGEVQHLQARGAGPPPPPPGPYEKGCTGSWGYQWCTEMVQPFTEGTDEDFYFCPNGTFYEAENCSAWDFDGASEGCVRQWGVTPRKEWARVMLGGKRIEQASNILFSNGEYDPWHNGGILANLSDTVVAVVIPNGAHHIDLMFSDPADTADIVAARAFEVATMQGWVKQAYEKRGVTLLPGEL